MEYGRAKCSWAAQQGMPLVTLPYCALYLSWTLAQRLQRQHGLVQAHKAGRNAGRSARSKHKLAKGAACPCPAELAAACCSASAVQTNRRKRKTDAVLRCVEGGARQPVKGGAKPAAGKAQRHLQAKQGRCAPAAPALCSCLRLCGADIAAGGAQGPAAGGAAGAAPRWGAAARGRPAAALCCERPL